MSGIDIVRGMYNELLVKRKIIGSKDFFINFKQFLAKTTEDKLE